MVVLGIMSQTKQQMMYLRVQYFPTKHSFSIKTYHCVPTFEKCTKGNVYQLTAEHKICNSSVSHHDSKHNSKQSNQFLSATTKEEWQWQQWQASSNNMGKCIALQ